MPQPVRCKPSLLNMNYLKNRVWISILLTQMPHKLYNHGLVAIVHFKASYFCGLWCSLLHFFLLLYVASFAALHPRDSLRRYSRIWCALSPSSGRTSNCSLKAGWLFHFKQTIPFSLPSDLLHYRAIFLLMLLKDCSICVHHMTSSAGAFIYFWSS